MPKKFTVACLATLVLFAVCGFVFNRSPIKAQVADKSVTVPNYAEPEPVKVAGLYLGTRQIFSGEKFSASDDWMKDLKVMVKNTASQDVKYISLAVEIKVEEVARQSSINLGRNYFANPNPTEGAELTLKPGEVATVAFSAYDAFVSHYKHEGLSAAAFYNPILYLQVIVFADDTAWYKGHWMTRDGANPRLWHRDQSRSPLKIGRRVDDGQFRMLKASAKPEANSSAAATCWYLNDVIYTVCTDLNCTPGQCWFYQEQIIASAYGDKCREFYDPVCEPLETGPCNCCERFKWRLKPFSTCPNGPFTCTGS